MLSYQIQSDNMDLSPSMVELAKQKFQRLSRHVKTGDLDSNHARVVMNTAPDDAFEVKVRLVLNGNEYFADEINPVLETALVLVVEELDRRLEKDKFSNKTEKDWQEKRESKRVSEEDLLSESE